ncbi:chemotaxis protein CheB [Desulfovibrio inopinatus]|uniref:chemotaxis protein CheB n=1 Tax=Desulfovibrio inopinatus TaxID=102109 RepID=UPI0004096126|nr:chemotaxis protein CheB [Desulfovibrio inopinatus]
MKEKYPAAIVLGASAGGPEAILYLLRSLPNEYPVPIFVVLHMHPNQKGNFPSYCNKYCSLKVKEAEDKEVVLPGTVYIAPPNYHLLLERDRTLALSVDARVKFSRPSIDVLFESAADVYKNELVGIILTGANDDGADGLKKIKQLGGVTIVQDPATAAFASMPKAAINIAQPDCISSLDEIIILLSHLFEQKTVSSRCRAAQ